MVTFIKINNLVVRPSDIKTIEVKTNEQGEGLLFIIFNDGTSHVVKYESEHLAHYDLMQKVLPMLNFASTETSNTKEELIKLDNKFIVFNGLKIRVDSITAYCLSDNKQNITLYTLGGTGKLILYFDSMTQAEQAINTLESLFKVIPLTGEDIKEVKSRTVSGKAKRTKKLVK